MYTAQAPSRTQNANVVPQNPILVEYYSLSLSLCKAVTSGANATCQTLFFSFSFSPSLLSPNRECNRPQKYVIKVQILKPFPQLKQKKSLRERREMTTADAKKRKLLTVDDIKPSLRGIFLRARSSFAPFR